jgi:translation initiation factor 4G
VQKICASSPTTAGIFRKLLLDKCQTEFQKSNSEEDKIKDMVKEIEQAEGGDKKEQLRLELEDMQVKMRRRSLGNVRFIGELFKLHMLTPKIMVSCIKMLLGMCCSFFCTSCLKNVLY